MTSITRDPVKSHELRAGDVIEGLKSRNFVLIDEIASGLYAKILQVIESDIPTISEWGKRDEKLKHVLQSQVEILGRLYVCEELIENLIVAEEEKIVGSLQDLVYEFGFLSLDLSSLFFELEYPTWNLLDFLNPSHYFTPKELPSSLLEALSDLSYDVPTKLSASLQIFCQALAAKGSDQESLKAVEATLTKFSSEVQRYKRLIQFFYETKDSMDALYAFHCVVSTNTSLLGVSLLLKLLLEPITKRPSRVSQGID